MCQNLLFKISNPNEFNDFKNSSKYAIWIDGKNHPNSELVKYSASDFVYFAGSSVYKNARSKNFHNHFNINFIQRNILMII